jgi:hypothetical protein
VRILAGCPRTLPLLIKTWKIQDGRDHQILCPVPFQDAHHHLHFRCGYETAAGMNTMMKRVAVAAMAASALMVASQAAEAKGCIKGAIVGGIAGHYAGHGVLGAVGGCVAGRALANRQAPRQQAGPAMTGNGAVRPGQGAGGYVGY